MAAKKPLPLPKMLLNGLKINPVLAMREATSEEMAKQNSAASDISTPVAKKVG